MKIKTKKQMNLPQLIEWGWKNDVRNKGFESERTSRAYFDYDGYLSCTRAMKPTDTFTVEVEEKITENTVIPRIAEIDLCGYDQHEDVFMQENKSINQILNEDEVKKRAFYILNDDLTMTLIWRDGKLVE